MTIADASTSEGNFEMQLVTTDGDSRTLGDCVLISGEGSCGGEIDVPLRDVLLVRLTKPGEPSLIARF